MQVRQYLPIVLVIGFFAVFSYLPKGPSGRVLAQDDDMPLTESQLVTRFTSILNEEVPVLNYTIDDGGAEEIRTFLVNAARNFINVNNFAASAKKEADMHIRVFAGKLKEKSKPTGAIEVDDKKLVIIAPQSPIGTQNDTANDGNSNIDVNTSINTNSNVATNSSVSVNANFQAQFDKKRVGRPAFLRNYFMAPSVTLDLELQRNKITKKVVATATAGWCPIIGIC